MLLLHNKIKYMRARMNHTYKIIENIIKGRSIITILLIKFQFLSNATTMTWNISNEDVESDRRRKKKKKKEYKKNCRIRKIEESIRRDDRKTKNFFFFFFPPFLEKATTTTPPRRKKSIGYPWLYCSFKLRFRLHG